MLFDRSGTQQGGGLSIINSQGVYIEGAHFKGNGIKLLHSDVHLSNSRLYSFDSSGDPVIMTDDSDLRISGCIQHSQNAASLFSVNNNSSLSADNLAAFENECENLFHVSASEIELDFVTFFNNSSSGWNAESSLVNIRNSILDHAPPDDETIFTVTYSALPLEFPGVGNISADPYIDTEDPFPVLRSVSPCISSGNPDTSGIPRNDLIGNPRPAPEWAPPDMGAFESERHVPEHAGNQIWVDPGGDDTWGNGSPDLPFAGVQRAVDIAADNDTVIIRSGTYRGSVKIKEKSLALASTYILDNDSTAMDNTVLLADTSVHSPVLTIIGVDSVAVLGLSLKEGSGRFFYPNYTYGGAVYCENSNCYLEHVRIEDNHADFSGGGIYALASTLHLHDVQLKNNYAYFGGALGLSGSTLKAAHTTIRNNSASSGGGIYAEDFSRLSILYSDISANTAQKSYSPVLEKSLSISEYGGGIYVKNTDLLIRNSLLSENHSENTGAVLASRYGNTEILQSTIADNSNDEDSSAVLYLISQYDPFSLVNSIVWNPGEIQITSELSDINISHTDLMGGTAGISRNDDNNSAISASSVTDNDPLFENGYALSPSSPCREAGTTLYTQGVYYLINYSVSDFSGTAPDLGHLGAHPEILFTKEAVNTAVRSIPHKGKLLNAYPNPFNPETNLAFILEEPGNVVLNIYDIRGRKVRTLTDGFFPAGQHNILFNARGLGAGIYLSRLYYSGRVVSNKKIVLLK
ncbi:MAG: T9SS type A sorting domain-containing protein [Candidatus Marinimicrobia bacterium]|nr:T9SS type A sorting domain-containing protein [Candidatus Neomarinimicrobiota bacterium]